MTSATKVVAFRPITESALDGFDVMINNAGIAQVNPIADVRPEEVTRILAVNVEGVLCGIQAAAARFQQRGHGGKIISTSSIAGHDGFAMLGVYCASKISRPAPSPSRRPRNTPAPASPSTPTAPASSAWSPVD